MNKSDLIEALSDHVGGKPTATKAVEVFIDTVTRAVAAGEKVQISGFGVFEKTDRAARMGRNPATGDPVKIKKTSVPKFRPGTDFKAYVSGTKKLAKATGTVARKATAKTVAARTLAAKAPGPRAKAAAAKTLASGAPARTAKAAAARATSATASTRGAKAAPARSAATKSAAAKTLAAKAPGPRAKAAAAKTLASKAPARVAKTTGRIASKTSTRRTSR